MGSSWGGVLLGIMDNRVVDLRVSMGYIVGVDCRVVLPPSTPISLPIHYHSREGQILIELLVRADTYWGHRYPA